MAKGLAQKEQRMSFCLFLVVLSRRRDARSPRATWEVNIYTPSLVYIVFLECLEFVLCSFEIFQRNDPSFDVCLTAQTCDLFMIRESSYVSFESCWLDSYVALDSPL